MFSTLFIKLLTQNVFCDALVITEVLEVTVPTVGVGATVATLTDLGSSGPPPDTRGIEIVYG